MRKLLMIVGLMLLTLPLYGQYSPLIHTSPYIDITITGHETQVVYILFPDDRNTWYVSQTLPTDSYAGLSQGRSGVKGYVTIGHNWLSWESNKTTGTPDSIGAIIKPLEYKPKDKTFVVGNDSTWLTFNGINTYISASADYTSAITDGGIYSTLLTNQLWPVEGFVIYFKQIDLDSDAMATVLTIWLKHMREWR